MAVLIDYVNIYAFIAAISRHADFRCYAITLAFFSIDAFITQ